MRSGRFALLLSLVLMAVGSLVAHVLAYRLIQPDAGARHAHLHETGHAYLAHWRMCAAICGAVLLIALVAAALDGVRRGRAVALPVWAFALVPPLGFVVQEHLERLLQTGSLPLGAVGEATFVLGILLQAPFALAAYVAARALLALARKVVARLLGQPRAAPRAPLRTQLPFQVAPPARIPALALGYGERGPPAPR